MNRVSNKVALISGGARGMGASHARLLVEEGARVVIGDVLDGEGEHLAEELGDNAHYVHLDVTNVTEWESAVAATIAAFGRLDILVNNAGIANGAAIADFPLDVWQRTLDINLTGDSHDGRHRLEPASDPARSSSRPDRGLTLGALPRE